MNADKLVEHILWPPASLEFALTYVYDTSAAREQVQGHHGSDFWNTGTYICEFRRINLSAFIQNIIRKYIVLLTMQRYFRTKYEQ